jgi:crotonobetainyl-CoA:carnitine CoA-transferase CaiB-like acyl-CoA transferase
MKRPELEKIRFPDDMFDMDIKGEIEVMWLEWLTERTKREAMEECQSVKWFVTCLNTPRDAVEDPHFKEHGFWVAIEHPVTGKQTYPGAPIRIGEGSWQVRRPAPLLGQHNHEIFGQESEYAKGHETGSMVQGSAEESSSGIRKLPLDGIRVVDLTVVFAGPFASWLLACLGAEVIHVDSIHHRPDMGRSIALRPTKEMIEGKDGDRYPNRDPGDRPWNRGAFFNRLGWNKRSCCINLKDPLGKDIFKRLIEASDVFIENNSASAMDHLGLGPGVLTEVNPRLICINMPSYGRTGPYSHYVGWGDNAESLTGHGWVRGYDDTGHPVHNTPMFHMDSTGGAMAAIGAILALRRRRRTGKGVAVDFAQIESMIPQLGEIYMDYTWNGKNQRTMGNRHPTSVQGCYRCRGEDRWINITINNDEEWHDLRRAMGNPPWTGEARFSAQGKRHENHDAFDRFIEEWTVRYDNFELFQILQQHGVPAGPVYSEKDTYNDPHLNARGFFEIIQQEETGTYRYPGFLWKMSDTPLSVRYPPPRMGEDNDYVFRNVIKMSEEEISELTEKKIIGGDTYTWI